MELNSLGDSALIVTLDGKDEADVDAVLAKLAHLRAAKIPGALEWTSAYSTIALFYDPVAVAEECGDPGAVFETLGASIRRALAGRMRRVDSLGRTMQIPVCYDSDLAFDLEDVAKNACLSCDEVVRLHSQAHYRVACVGFTPGFPYLTGLPPQLATPRRARPRTEVPAGSVAIGGEQTGIYPGKTPGGWNVIGRTPLRLFDAANESPALLAAGDRVSFQRVSRKEFDELSR